MTDEEKKRLYFVQRFKWYETPVGTPTERNVVTRADNIQHRLADDEDKAEAYTTPTVQTVSSNAVEVCYRPDKWAFDREVTFGQDGNPTIDPKVMRKVCEDTLAEKLGVHKIK